jgi:competence CoiA-like predicted nuclease
MLYAIDENGKKILPVKGSRGLCPDCNEPLTPKCGEIITWHWAHKSGADCEVWSEPESAWHLWWKSCWPPDCVEVPITKNGKRHRADVLYRGTVIEFQKSSISSADIRAREEFYSGMVWIFYAEEQFANTISLYEKQTNSGVYFSIRWDHPRKSISHCLKPVYLDFGMYKYKYNSDMFILKSFPADNGGYGWGRSWDRINFINRFGDLNFYRQKLTASER